MLAFTGQVKGRRRGFLEGQKPLQASPFAPWFGLSMGMWYNYMAMKWG